MKLIVVSLVSLFLFNVALLQAQTPLEENNKTSTVNSSSSSAATLVGYWRLDETSGNSFEDSVGTLDGVCVAGNCPTPTNNGRVNGAQVFSEVLTDAIDIPANSIFNWGPNDSFSIAFWMKGVPGKTCAKNSIPGGNQVIVGRDDGNTQLHWWIGCQGNGGHALWRLEDTDGDADAVVLESSNSINDGNWHHIVAVRDGANKVNRLYVDGAVADSATNAIFSAGFGSNSAAVNIGWQNLPPFYHFRGTIDEIRIYKGALSTTEVKQIKDNINPPLIVSSPVTRAKKDNLYTYEVKVTGKLPINYKLLEAPAGMTINASTGVVSWTPSTEGSYNVRVEAKNDDGTDEQSFSVKVIENFIYLPIVIR